ncbi:MAG: hypothetical protein NVS3B26_28310 [Mycobacteriales bacterium]
MQSTSEQRPGTPEVPSPAELGAHASAVIAALPAVAAVLRDTLGAGAVARLAGVTETRAVHQWASGEREVRSSAVEQRLRIAFQLVSMLLPLWPAAVVSTWFQVPNPYLGYRAPLELLEASGGAGREAASVVAAAASRFRTEGALLADGVSLT